MENSDKKKLPMRISFKELASMMDVCYSTLRNELNLHAGLVERLEKMGWRSYKRLRRNHVLEIFKVMGFPDGYEWYENEITNE